MAKIKNIRSIIALFVILGILAVLTFGYNSDYSNSKLFNDKNFTIKMPSDTSSDKKTVKTDFGEIEMNILSAYKKNIYYSFSYFDLSSDYVKKTKTADILNKTVKGSVKNISGKLFSREKIKTGVYEGVKIKIGNPDKLIIESRIFLVKERLFTLIVVIKSPFTLNYLKREDFFSSFKVLNENK